MYNTLQFINYDSFLSIFSHSFNMPISNAERGITFSSLHNRFFEINNKTGLIRLIGRMADKPGK